MANKPIFITSNNPPFYRELNIPYTFYPGFATIQKQKCINSLHQSATKYYPNLKILEISTKSNVQAGVEASAFNLLIKTKYSNFSVECAFQSSKTFENGGPFHDILKMNPKDAKQDLRLKNSGKLIGFKYFQYEFPLFPKDYFYNWLYINALARNDDLSKEILKYNSFSDIEFNPKKSINCQAKAAAIFVSLKENDLLELALKSRFDFLKTIYGGQNI